MGFVHKTALIGLMLVECVVAIAVCGADALAVALCNFGALVLGSVVAHMAELFLRHSYAEKANERRRQAEETEAKKRLEERNEQLKAEKERLMYDVQRSSNFLDEDERNVIRRGLQGRGGAPSDSAPPSLPPGPPSTEGSEYVEAPTLSWADVDRQSQEVRPAQQAVELVAAKEVAVEVPRPSTSLS